MATETEMVYGSVQRITTKAVLLAVQDTGHDTHGLSGQVWFPLSQVDVLERAMGPLDAVRAPSWLVRARRQG